MLDTAKRELYEETSLIGYDWAQLDSMCMLPRIFYSGHEKWKDHPYVIPEYAFSVQVFGEPQLSAEHTEFRWCNASDVSRLLKYDSNRIALWELCDDLSYLTDPECIKALEFADKVDCIISYERSFFRPVFG